MLAHANVAAVRAQYVTNSRLPLEMQKLNAGQQCPANESNIVNYQLWKAKPDSNVFKYLYSGRNCRQQTVVCTRICKLFVKKLHVVGGLHPSFRSCAVSPSPALLWPSSSQW